ncbi:Cytoplasmic thioredoxin isoenzyme 2 [Boothiomyces sp. JEL0838]|nr:Cytoplasmic thioredoxin isoenzyme 2 [Boothiomyces sp. JEL0838]
MATCMADYNLSLEEYQETVQNSPLVFVKVGATWCPPCKVIKPVFQNLSNMYTNAKFIAIDSDTSEGNEAFASKYEIQSYPTFLVFHNGKVIQTLIGADKQSLEAMVEMMTNSPTDKFVWWGFSCDVCNKLNIIGEMLICKSDEFMVCSSCQIPKDHPHSKEEFMQCSNFDDYENVQLYSQMTDRIDWLMSLDFCKMSREDITKLYLENKGNRLAILTAMKGVEGKL